MDNKVFKILKELEPYGVGVYTSISPVLLELYSGVNKMDRFSVSTAWGQAYSVLHDMVTRGYIFIEPQQSGIGSGNDTAGYGWFDIIPYKVRLLSGGLEAIEAEVKKGQDDRLKDSMIEANQAVTSTYISTKDNYDFQKKAMKWTISLSALSTLFILVTILLSVSSNTQQPIEKATKELQTLTKTVESTKVYLQEINRSIQKLQTYSDSLKK